MLKEGEWVGWRTRDANIYWRERLQRLSNVEWNECRKCWTRDGEGSIIQELVWKVGKVGNG